MISKVLFGVCLCVVALPLFTSASTIGLYTLTFGSPNELNIFRASGTDGQFTYVKQVSTGGNGQTGNLQSQNPLIVHGNHIFAVNPSSNSVSLLAINVNDPTDVTLIGTADSGGDFPVSVTANDNYACVVNDGMRCTLRCYTFNNTGLYPISGSDRTLNQTLDTPPQSHTGPAQISFTPDNSGLVISIKSDDPALLLFTFSSGTVGATSVSAASMGGVPFGFTFDPNNNNIVLTNAGFGVIEVSVATNTPSFSYQGSYFSIVNQTAACWASRSSATGHYYISNAGSASIADLSLSGSTFTNNGDITLNAAGCTNSVVSSWDGNDYLFQFAKGTIFSFKLSTSAAPAPLQTINAQSGSYGDGVATYVSSAGPTSPPSATTSSAASLLASLLVNVGVVLMLTIL